MPTLRDTLAYEPVELSFGTSGLRGLASDMTDLECYINTAGFLQFLHDNESLAPGSTIYLAGDLRESTPRILHAVHQAIVDTGFATDYCGLIPTPAIAFYAQQRQAPCIMVTGSHIPADRNGIKFYKPSGEVLKADETAIKTSVAKVRQELYTRDNAAAGFDVNGMLLDGVAGLPGENTEAAAVYERRYTDIFDHQTLAGKEIIFYQHSAVGRDLLVDILRKLGATVKPVGRSDVFIPIDSENVTPENQVYFRQLAAENPTAFAIVSTDGDSDRPFVIDASGTFHRGDVLGAVVADWLQADFAAFPISSSDAVDAHLSERHVPFTHTKIGSPYVIVAMQEALKAGKLCAVGWEVNGGFLLGCDLLVNGAILGALPTRDALLPILGALIAAKDTSVEAIFQTLPQRFTQAGLIDNFPVEISRKILDKFGLDSPDVRDALGKYFSPEHNFGRITRLDALDGVRVFFDNGDIAHLRPSGNAPQLRIYSVADSQTRADEIVRLAIAEPDGIFRQIEDDLR